MQRWLMIGVRYSVAVREVGSQYRIVGFFAAASITVAEIEGRRL